jgi:hypothetical protein
MPDKPELDEATRRIAERMLSTPPKPHDQMKVGKPRKDAAKPEKKRTAGKGRARVGKAKG